jgi:hypothetical protein
MPRVTIRTGFVAANGQEEVLTEYLCDWPDCAHVAEYLIPVVSSLRDLSVICREHAALLERRGSHF